MKEYDIIAVDAQEILRRVWSVHTFRGTHRISRVQLIEFFKDNVFKLLNDYNVYGPLVLLWDLPPFYLGFKFPEYKSSRKIPTIDLLRKLEKNLSESDSSQQPYWEERVQKESNWQYNEDSYNSARGLIQQGLSGISEFQNLCFSGYEADDIAYTISKLPLKTCLISSDQDWIRCINETTHLICYGGKSYDRIDVIKRYSPDKGNDLDLGSFITMESDREALVLSREFNISVSLVSDLISLSDRSHNDLILTKKDPVDVLISRDFSDILDYLSIKERFCKYLIPIVEESIYEIHCKYNRTRNTTSNS